MATTKVSVLELTAPRGLGVTIEASEQVAIACDVDDLRSAISDACEEDDSDAVRVLIRIALHLGLEVTVESDDTEEEECGDPSEYLGSMIATTQVHHLLIDGQEVASLDREGWSYYGSIDHPNTPNGEWTTDVGENDRGIPGAWDTICAEAGLTGDWNRAPEAREPDEVETATDPDGEYCLCWVTSGDDAGPLPEKRYSTYEDAQNACRRADHLLHMKHRGALLCGYGICQLVDGEWGQVDPDVDDDD